jgi:hypothetical protein
LTEEERHRLETADGKGDQFVHVVAELADHHPVLPPLPTGPIMRWEDLPARAKVLLNRIYRDRPGKLAALRFKEGKWPEYALACMELLPANRRADMPPLGASRPLDFSSPIQSAIVRLGEKHPEDATLLRRWEGRWPEYPQRLLELARKHKSDLPGMTLPASRDLWEHNKATPSSR